MYSGWRLFSDEFALLQPDSGIVNPAPRPVSLKNASIEVIGLRHPEAVFSPEQLDIDQARFVHARPPADAIQRAHEQGQPGWIVLPRYVPGAATTLEPLPKAQALMAVADQSFNYNFLGVKGYTCLTNLVRRSGCYRLEYSDLDDALGRLAGLTER
jgi:HprK-related kinase A